MATHTYLRVSTNVQSTDTQEHDLLKRYPDAVVHRETASGVKQRPVLAALVASLQSGDTLVVAALDRLGRRTSEILKLIEDLQKRNVNIVALREGVDYGTITGRLVTQILVSVAELERSLTAARTSAALQALKAKGVQLGKPSKFTEVDLKRAKELHQTGHSYRKIQAMTGMSFGRIAQALR